MNTMPAACSAAANSRVLREESVSGVHGLRAGADRGLDDRVDVEVALPRRRGADAHGGVGLRDVAGAGVGVAVDGDRADTHGRSVRMTRHRDLAAVGDQNGVESLGSHRAVTSGTRRRTPARAVPVRQPKAPAPARFWCRQGR